MAGFNAFEQFSNAGPASADSSLGFSMSVGYRLNPRLSGEINWSTVGGWELRDVPGVPDNTFQIEGGTFTGDVKGYLLTGKIQPFAQVGMGLMYGRFATVASYINGCNYWYCTSSPITTDSEVEFVARPGGGVDYWVSP